ncbi:sulfatase-like hydrolase/transferase [Roseiconus nitratireducens]|uniref:Sulfatase-like hydrolase/transferase n=1 Tax=Roseiconus nitratireducens TaxID=2605748 RepID=A0A5M6DD67_9BACT|nr:arylsulfatase [Roseiconus nitratireducens]KAA5544350.1 sulfatase-like hydrolase/transferase [Roseiconus nitratireducens]
MKFHSIVLTTCILFVTNILSGVALAQQGIAPTDLKRQAVLPYAEQKFTGNVGTTYKDSDPAQFPKPMMAPAGAPNVLLILLDDVGFGQFSVSGGGVPSPSMEKLAKEGVFYNRFHTTAVCSPTRAALLTGRNHHVAGTGNITEVATGYDGYTGIIPKETATIAEILRQNGYITSWFGKNHNTPAYETSQMGPFDRWPNGLGFDHFYGFMAGDTNQVRPNLYENQTPIGTPQAEDYYLSVDLADKTIAWLQEIEAIQPDKAWFTYLAPAATHAPHQAPQELIDQFAGQYDDGWDAYREQTLQRQKELGVVPEDAELTPRPEGLPAWEALSQDEKRVYARMMEVFAAYGLHVDQQVGRVLDYVATLPDADNTLVIYIIGDNGSSAEGGLPGTLNENAIFNGYQMKIEDILPHLDEIGTEKHFNHFPAAWAHAMDTPFQWTKQVASHLGGTRNVMLMKWPARYDKGGQIRSQFTHVIDVAPTILEAAGIEEPRSVNGTAQTPIQGKSFLASLSNPDTEEHRTSQYFELFANRGMYKDGWWAGSMAFEPWNPNRKDFDPLAAEWELYNLEEDFSQANNLAKENPEKLEELKALWWAQASANKALPLDWRGPERFSAELTGKPNLARGRSRFEYRGPLSGLPESSAPDLKNKSFSITAKVKVDDGANGMIFTQGGNTGGWAFYLQNGKLHAAHNFIDIEHYSVTSDAPIEAGEHELGMSFEYQGGDKLGGSGTATLTVDGKPVGSGAIEKTTPFKYSVSEYQDIGTDTGTPVTYDYQTPLNFEGELREVVVELARN